MPKLLRKTQDSGADISLKIPQAPDPPSQSQLQATYRAKASTFSWPPEEQPSLYAGGTGASLSHSFNNHFTSQYDGYSIDKWDNPLETHRSYSNGDLGRSTPPPPRRASFRHITEQQQQQNSFSQLLSNGPRSSAYRGSLSTPSLYIPNSNNTQFGGGLTPRGTRDIFDEVNEDIMKAAAQREQQRGAGRHIRGTMGPVLGKEEDRTSQRKTSQQQKNSSENIYNALSLSNPLTSSSSKPLSTVLEPNNTYIAIGVIKSMPITRRNSNANLNNDEDGSNSFLADISRNDIMTQSIRRQSRKSTKPNLGEMSNGINSDGSNNMPPGIITRGHPSEEFLMFNPSNVNFSLADLSNSQKDSRKSRKSSQTYQPSTHEDVQILNLHGFMDNNSSTPTSRMSTESTGSLEPKKKSKRRRNKRNDEYGIDTGLGSKDRRRRFSRSRGKQDDDEDIALRDVDELDDEMSGLVIGPKLTSRDLAGTPIVLEEATELRKALTGNPVSLLPTEWMTQNFEANKRPNLPYGLLQKKGGPCGVLACVQSHMLKCLMFGSLVSPETSIASPLRPSSREWQWALSVALTEIIWRAGSNMRAILTLPSSFPHFSEHGVGRYSQDGVTETLNLYTFTKQTDLYQAIENNIQVFTRTDAPACVLLLYSAMLTRGLENVSEDMDAGGGQLINSHGYSSQEVVNLLLTGQANTNTFDGVTTLEGGPISSTLADKEDGLPSKLTLRGVQNKSDIGLLSLFDHYGSCKVGEHLKSPEYPIWVVCSESHYTCLFSRDTTVTSGDPLNSTFDVFYYDGLAQQEDEIRITISLTEELDDTERTLIPPLEHCIRTKWRTATLDWNGTEPLL